MSKIQDCIDYIRKNPDIVTRYGGKEAIAKAVGCTARTVRNALKENPTLRTPYVESTAVEDISVDYKSDTAAVIIRSLTINTLDKALEVANVDLDIWEVERYVTNSWGVTMKINDEPVYRTNYQVKVWLRRKVSRIVEEAMRGLISSMPRYKSPKQVKIPDPAGEFMFEIGLYDHHFALLAWEPETGNSYDLKIAERLYLDGGKTLISRANGYDISRFMIVIGNDMFHTQTNENATARNKNPLDVDGRVAKIFETAFNAVINLIEYCEPIAPVDILFVPGNHDAQISWFLVRALYERYRNCERITIDKSPMARKYYQWGCGMIGLTHGIDEKQADLPQIMATEQPQMWAATKHREWHTGHFHKKKETKYIAADTFGGVSVRVLPSLCGTDAWHYSKGYIHPVKSVEGHLWSKTDGYTGYFNVNI